MTRNNFITQSSYALTFSLLLSFGAAQAEEASPPVLLESFACSYHDGKDRDDLLTARDYMVKQAAKAEMSLTTSYVWHRYKGGPDLDHVWFSVHESLATFAAQSEAFGAAPEMADVEARFESVAECDSNIAMARPVFQGSESSNDGGTAFIASNACMVQPGTSPADLIDLENHIRDVLGGISEYNASSVFMATPMTAGPNSADAYLFAVHPSQSQWAATSAAFQASAGRDSLVRHFQAVLDCKTSLWFSEQVVGEAE